MSICDPECFGDFAQSEAVTSLKKNPIMQFQMVHRLIVRPALPCFFMRSNLQINQPFSLHFFEPRYRRLIARVMHDVPDQYKREWEPIEDESLLREMCYCPINYVEAGCEAFICHVTRCRIANDGRADVELTPVKRCVIERAGVLMGDEDVGLYSSRVRIISIEGGVTTAAGDGGGEFDVEDIGGGTDQAGLISFIQMLIANGGAAGP